MSSGGSVSLWIAELKDGDEAAAQRIWERYYERLVSLARKRLQPSPRRAADEEDVTQNAFNSFFLGVSRGRFPRLDDRDDLWRLLVVITARKALDQLKQERSRPQVGGRAASVQRIDLDDDWSSIQQVIGDEPSPEFASQVAEEYDRLLHQLGDDKLRQVAVWKMEGYSNNEIAEKLGSSLRTVARKLDAIRIIWHAENQT